MFLVYFYFYRNSMLVRVQEYSVTFSFTQYAFTIFSTHTDNVFLGKVVTF